MNTMSEFTPVATVEDLNSLDEGEIVDGYLSGLRGEPEPGSNRSRAYWHGWRNGMADSSRMPIDTAQRQLAHAVVGPSMRMRMH
jgi:hypothetical protein